MRSFIGAEVIGRTVAGPLQSGVEVGMRRNQFRIILFRSCSLRPETDLGLWTLDLGLCPLAIFYWLLAIEPDCGRWTVDCGRWTVDPQREAQAGFIL